FSGVRMRFEGKSDPDVVTRPHMMEGFEMLARREIPFEFLVTTKHLKDILKVYEHVPELHGVIEHMGKPDLRRGTDWNEWSQLMKALAKNSNVSCKLSIGPRAEDLAEIEANQGQGWPIDRIRPYIGLL